MSGRRWAIAALVLVYMLAVGLCVILHLLIEKYGSDRAAGHVLVGTIFDFPLAALPLVLLTVWALHTLARED